MPSGLLSAHAWKEHAHHLAFLEAIHIRENQELCLRRDVPAFESMANLISFFLPVGKNVLLCRVTEDILHHPLLAAYLFSPS